MGRAKTVAFTISLISEHRINILANTPLTHSVFMASLPAIFGCAGALNGFSLSIP